MSALILTHGFATSEDSWASQIAGLGDKFDIATWNLPGHGSDDRIRPPDADLRSEAIAELESLVARTADRPYLVGHSLGGYLSLRFAISHPAAARGLVLIATGPGFRSRSKMALWNESIDGMLTSSELNPNIATLSHMNDSMVIDRLAEIQLPVLLIVGSADRQDVQRGTRYLSRMLPRASHLIAQDARHNPHKTHPSEVNRAIEEFVRETEARHFEQTMSSEPTAALTEPLKVV